ncbi:diguanylate cyclase domain-containing protein [Arenimonas sp.]|uniref:diguanylate cyclase domain-containing protein n=1 Tax=Arenimonas sp. TaxID=1872635 RepID=UPI0039E2BC69
MLRLREHSHLSRLARLFTILAALLPAFVLAQAQDRHEYLSLRQFGADAGLPQLTVLAIARDRAGYLYVGTQDGLSRYDGRRFENVPLEADMHGIVGKLLADDSGLWVGTDEHGLFRVLADGKVQRAQRDDGQAWPAIEALASTRDGRSVWVGTPSGLFRCEQLRCMAVPGTDGLDVSALLEGQGPEGPCLWIGTNSRGVLRFDHHESGLQRSELILDRNAGLPNSVVRALAQFGAPGGDGQPPLWIATGRGVAVLRDTRVLAHESGKDFPVGSAMAMAVARDPRGKEQLYVGLYGGGLVRFDDSGAFRAFGLDEGLPERFVYSLLALDQGADQPSQLWIGTSAAGLLRVDPGRWFSLDERQILPAPNVVAVGELQGPDGQPQVWAGTSSGAVVQDGRGGWKYLLPNPYRDHVVYSALMDPLGRLWAGTLDGLLLVQGSETRMFSADEHPLPGVSIQELLWRGGRDGELWIGTGHGLGRWRDNRFDRVNGEDERLRGAGIRALVDLSDRPGNEAAIGTSEGLFFSDGVRLRSVPAGCLPHREVMNLVRGGRDVLWVATRGGAARVALTANGFDCRALKLPGNGPKAVYALAIDRQSRLYLFGYDGGHRIDNPDALLQEGASLQYSHYGLADGLPSLEFNRDALIDREGGLWAANNAGLVAFEPDAVLPMPGPPPLRLDARSGQARLRPGQSLPYDHAPLRFDYRLLSFHAEHRIRYRSRLVGLDGSGSDWMAESEREFSRLPPGDYRFQLEARDAYGRVLRQPDIVFSVAHPWWQHPMTLALATLALLLAGLGIGRWRARALAQRAATLELEVRQRTDALAGANLRLEQASRTDPMTGVYNRRHFYASIHELLRRYERDGLWLLLVDIDHFKQINDQRGHAAGDDVLIEISRRLVAAIGESGWVVRWGGEEFLLACDASTGIEPLCRRLLDAVAATPVRAAGEPLSVSCSIGATHVQPPADGMIEHVDTIVARADAALYRAKNDGRRRAMLAGFGGDPQLHFTEVARS